MPEPVLARAHGRAREEARPISFELGFTRYAEGSVLARFGETWVLCNATVEDRVPAHCEEFGRGWITAEYAMLPRSTHERTSREGLSGPPRGRTQEIQRLIGRSMRAVADLRMLSGFTIRLDCDVLQADGGTRTAAISGCYVATMLAVRGLREDDLIPGNPMLTAVAAISTGLVDGEVLVDLDYTEDSRAQVDTNLVMDSRGRFVEIQSTAEAEPFDSSQLTRMLELGSRAITRIMALQREALGELPR